MRFTVAVAATDRPSWLFVTSLLSTRIPDGGGFTFLHENTYPALDAARNKLVRDFLARDGEWLLMVDSDIVYLPDTLIRLVSWGLPLVSALVFHRPVPHLPMIYRGAVEGEERARWIKVDETHQWIVAHPKLWTIGPAILDPRPDDAVVPVDFTGMGCVLVHRSVIAAFGPPWFRLNENLQCEDRFFYEQASKAGFATYVDRSCTVSHIPGDNPISALDFEAWYAISKFGD